MSSSGRVSPTQADHAAAGGGRGQGPVAEAGEVEEDEPEEVWGSPLLALDADCAELEKGGTGCEKGVLFPSNHGSGSSVSTLFVDGIEESINYHHIWGLFLLFGSILRVFVQRNRKIGRRFRFGFISFLSVEHASSAACVIDGLRVGGVTLAVSPARFPKDVVKAPVFGSAHSKGSPSQMASISSVRGKVLVEEEMGQGLQRGCLLGERFPDAFLFPEIDPLFLGSHMVGVIGEGEGLRVEVSVDVAGLGSPCKEDSGDNFSFLPPPFADPSLPIETVKASRPRGRPKKAGVKGLEKTDPHLVRSASLAGGAEVTEGKELMVLPSEFSNPCGVMTRARSVVLVGKRLGLSFDCTDVAATNAIAAQIVDRRPH